jgi:DNA-binding transcriptional LysR family regulator
MQLIFSLEETMKIEEIGVWEAFRAVALHSGFSKAAKELRVSVPQISKRVAKLEEHLGVRLFHRSTRMVNLTEDGKVLLPKVTAILDDLAGIETSFESSKELTGTIRITSVPFLAEHLLIPVIEKFKKIHPKVSIEIELSEGVMNLVESNIDLAIRIYDEPEDTSLIYRKLAPNRLIFCASLRYLKEHSAPLRNPNDLHRHEVLMLDVHRHCQFEGKKNQIEEFIPSKKIICENGWFLTRMAIQGLGVLVRSEWDVQRSLDKGELIQVLKKFPLESFGHIYAVIPSRRLLAPRVRAFLDFIMAESGKRPMKEIN